MPIAASCLCSASMVRFAARSCRQLCLPSARVGHGILLIYAPWCAFFFCYVFLRPLYLCVALSLCVCVCV